MLTHLKLALSLTPTVASSHMDCIAREGDTKESQKRHIVAISLNETDCIHNFDEPFEIFL